MNFRSYFIPPGPISVSDLVYLYYLLLLPTILILTAVSVVFGINEVPVSTLREFGICVLFAVFWISSTLLTAKYSLQALHSRYKIQDSKATFNSMRFGLHVFGIFCWTPRIYVLFSLENLEMVYLLDLVVLIMLIFTWIFLIMPFKQQYRVTFGSEDVWRVLLVTGLNIALFHIMAFIGFQHENTKERDAIVLQQFLSFALCLTTQIELIQLKNGRYQSNECQTDEQGRYQRLRSLSEKLLMLSPKYQKKEFDVGLQEAKKQSHKTLEQFASRTLHADENQV